MSYVWGNAKHLTLRTDTFRRLTSPNGLSDELEDIPRSFQDAMRLVGCLGLEYLWIDALCIKQDDADDVDSHLRAMDSIYSCAALTIVAATDSVDTGLPGMHLLSRLKSQNVYRSGGIMLINARHTFSEALRKSAWESRADNAGKVLLEEASDIRGFASVLPLQSSHLVRGHNHGVP